MAYVGTPRYYGDNRTTLASIIQGEASGGAGQVAVANVMMNRAATNYGGHGDIMGQALARMQFQGQVPVSQITPGSYAVADQALAGTLPNIVPNSLNYAARQGTTATWALNALNSGQGVNIGGNNFFVNDRGGTPIYNPNAIGGTSAPSFGTGDYSNYGQVDVGTRTTSSYTDASGNVTETWDFGDDATSGKSPFGVTGTNVSSSAFAGNLNTTDPLNPNAAQAGGINPTGSFGLGGPTGVTGANSQAFAQTQNQGGQSSRTGSSGGGGSSGAFGSMTVPQAIDTQTRGNASDTSSINRTNTSNTDSTNKTAKENTESLNKTSTANTKSGTDKAQSLYDATASAWSDYFVRLVFIVVGLIALAAALVMFKPVQNVASAVIPAGRVAKAVKLAKTAP